MPGAQCTRSPVCKGTAGVRTIAA